MSHVETYTSNLLNVEMIENDQSIHVILTGKGADREPGKFLTPILSNILNNSSIYNKEIIIDFVNLEYMNSSTITPFTKIMEQGKENGNKIQIYYNKTKKWQEFCFSALKIFETKDQRIEIIGK